MKNRQGENMIKIYLSGSCSSCRKAKKWLRKRHIEFEEIKTKS